MKYKLWLDDVRPCPFIGNWKIAKNYDEAIAILQENEIQEAWLDHDLAEDHYTTNNDPDWVSPNKTGYDVVLWMHENNKWPTQVCMVHSLNPVGADRMCNLIADYYGTKQHMKHYMPFTKLMKFFHIKD